MKFGNKQRKGRRNQRSRDQYTREKTEIISQRIKGVIAQKIEANRKIRVSGRTSRRETIER